MCVCHQAKHSRVCKQLGDLINHYYLKAQLYGNECLYINIIPECSLHHLPYFQKWPFLPEPWPVFTSVMYFWIRCNMKSYFTINSDKLGREAITTFQVKLVSSVVARLETHSRIKLWYLYCIDQALDFLLVQNRNKRPDDDVYRNVMNLLEAVGVDRTDVVANLHLAILRRHYWLVSAWKKRLSHLSLTAVPQAKHLPDDFRVSCALLRLLDATLAESVVSLTEGFHWPLALSITHMQPAPPTMFHLY